MATNNVLTTLTEMKDKLKYHSDSLSLAKKFIDECREQIETLENSIKPEKAEKKSSEVPEKGRKRQISGHALVLQEMFEEIVDEVDLAPTTIVDRMRERNAVSPSDDDTPQRLMNSKDRTRYLIVTLIYHEDNRNIEVFVEELRKFYPDLAKKIHNKLIDAKSTLENACIACKIRTTVLPTEVQDKLFANGILTVDTMKSKFVKQEHWDTIFHEIEISERDDVYKLLSESINLKNKELSEQILEKGMASLQCICENIHIYEETSEDNTPSPWNTRRNTRSSHKRIRSPSPRTKILRPKKGSKQPVPQKDTHLKNDDGTSCKKIDSEIDTSTLIDEEDNNAKQFDDLRLPDSKSVDDLNKESSIDSATSEDDFQRFSPKPRLLYQNITGENSGKNYDFKESNRENHQYSIIEDQISEKCFYKENDVEETRMENHQFRHQNEKISVEVSNIENPRAFKRIDQQMTEVSTYNEDNIKENDCENPQIRSNEEQVSESNKKEVGVEESEKENPQFASPKEQTSEEPIIDIEESSTSLVGGQAGFVRQMISKFEKYTTTTKTTTTTTTKSIR